MQRAFLDRVYMLLYSTTDIYFGQVGGQALFFRLPVGLCPHWTLRPTYCFPGPNFLKTQYYLAITVLPIVYTYTAQWTKNGKK